MRTIQCSYNYYSSTKTVGALQETLELHESYQFCSYYTFRDHSVNAFIVSRSQRSSGRIVL